MATTARSGGSRGSRLSSKRSNYKLLSKTSEVDETLFASTAPKGRPRSQQGQSSYVSKEMMATFGDAVVIGNSELHRLKDAATVRTHEMEQAAAAWAKSEKDKAQGVAKARKDKILAMEIERKKKEAKSDLEIEGIEKDQHQLSRADFLVDEQRDDVKKMNQFVKYAKCAAIRDAQLEEKKSLQRQQEEEDMYMDASMEEERQRAVELYEQREKQRQVDRIHGKEVICEQIAARERDRLTQQGILEQERDAMLRCLERLKEEDLLKQEMKKGAAKKLMAEVAVSNAQMTKLKELKRQREKEEDARIAQYLQDKAKREQEHQEMLDRAAADKEAECAALRAQQEKETDKKAELDALRAKRAMEQYERDWRQKERSAIEKQKRQNSMLSEARTQQKKEKERRLEYVAKAEREEFDRILKVQRDAAAVEFEKERQKEEAKTSWRNDLIKQIDKNQGESRQARAQYLEEGRKLRKEISKEKAHLEKIKERKIQELQHMGIPDKYLLELARHKIDF
eukprot:TRINITY_DN27184_c0_g1_i1.p1 TRINITY_DN27184_c0_g1~~TRINITY_DN27184_c0_g1_i1.p1  ORF type:complete len:511 (+),score=238.17 TRINITY_DN27184_c0_g1_i1:212-1744(+)